MLRRVGEDAVVFERGEIGAAWTTRYDRLRLHTVRWLSALPGYPIPRSFGKWPARDGVVDYLRRYVAHHGLEVRTGVEIERIERAENGWALSTAGGPVAAERVVVATGLNN